MLTSIRRQARGAKYRREAPGLHQRAFSGKPHSCCATTLHEGYIYHKTPDGCKGGWTCAKHAPRRGEDSMGRLRIKTPDGCKGGWTCVSRHAPEGRGAVRRLRVNYRYYNPTDGRWTRRDPIDPYRGKNRYLLAYNRLLIDYLGLDEVDVSSYNCYAHALGRYEWTEPDGITLYPSSTEEEIDAYDADKFCQELKEAVIRDGGMEPDNGNKCCEGYRRIYIVVQDKSDRPLSEQFPYNDEYGAPAPGGWHFDAHFAREEEDGSWTHKPGELPVRNYDGNGKKIENPEEAYWFTQSDTVNRDSRKRDYYKYSKHCGYMCVKK